MRNKVELMVVHPEDLSMEVMQQKISRQQPRRDVRGCDRLIAYLDLKGRSCRS